MRRLICLLLLLAPSLATASYADHPRATELLQLLADKYRFNDDDLAMARRALASANKVPKLIAAEQNAKEKTLTWTRYRPIHINQRNIERGAAFMREQAQWLSRAEAEFGVPAEVIAAILGVETKWGGYTGPHRVLDSLATQGFDHPRRHAFFFIELAEYLAFCRDQQRDPTDVVGSYAGAMGLAQFMPSNYRRLALDYDDDGDVDLWSIPDAIGSVAAYLVRYRPSVGWQRGQPVAVRAVVSGEVTTDSNPRKPNSTVRSLAERGVTPAVSLDQTAPAAHVELVLDAGHEHWIGLNNFFSIMSYNPRVFYAMSVYELSQAIAVAAVSAD